MSPKTCDQTLMKLDFRKTLSGIDNGLDMLTPILKELSSKTGVALTKEVDGRKKGALSGLWRRSKE